jgi:hypothetical protein
MSSSLAPRIMRHDSAALGRLEQAERAPHPLLAGIVRRYCGYDHDCTGATRRREVAQDEVTIILSLGPLLRVGGPDHPPGRYGSFVAALTDTYAITEHDGRLSGIEIDLSPLGAHMLFGVAMHELSSKLVLPLDDVLGAEAGHRGSRSWIGSSFRGSSAPGAPRPTCSGHGAGSARPAGYCRWASSPASSAAAAAI